MEGYDDDCDSWDDGGVNMEGGAGGNAGCGIGGGPVAAARRVSFSVLSRPFSVMRRSFAASEVGSLAFMTSSIIFSCSRLSASLKRLSSCNSVAS